MTKLDKKTSAYRAGEALQTKILKHGITIGTLKQIKSIVKNHGDDMLKVFFEGLMGIVKDGKSSS